MKYAIDRFAAGAGLEMPHITKSHAPTGPRLLGLDGLRAVAVIAVMLFHADLAFARGGFLGVDLFFVISGFLITGLLAGESERTGRVHLGQFYWRRAKRLLPASWAMTAAAVLAAAIWAPDALPRLRWDGLASLFYVTNWELIYADSSYFEAMGRAPLLRHLWSLAIEEQFYIFWAPVMFLVLPRLGRKALTGIAAALAVVSIGWMALKAAQMGYPYLNNNPNRLYFGTDTHGFGLLIGAALGLMWQPVRLPARLTAPEREGMFLFGMLALAATFASFYFLDEAKAWLYPWGFVLSAGLSVSLIMAATHPAASFGAWLDWRPARWIGERSYGLYLWHWPVYMLTRPGVDLHWPEGQVQLLRFALTFAIAALSYRYVEMPIRQGALEGLRARLSAVGAQAMVWRPALVALLAGGAALAAVIVLVLAPSQTQPAADVIAAMTLGKSVVKSKPVAIPQIRPGAETPADMYSGDVSAVGDSVLLGSSGVLGATIPGVKVYAHVGAQAAAVLDQIKKLHDAHALTPIFIVHLGTNGFVLEKQLRAMLDLLKDCKRVVLVNTHVPRSWMDENNELISRVVPDYRNTVLADWKTVSEGQVDFFVSDGVHLTVAGQRAFISEIIRAGHIALPPNMNRKHGVDPNSRYAFAPGDLSKTLVRYPAPMVEDGYWTRIAKCEAKAGHGGGDLDIAMPYWTSWGGTEFAATPAGATAAQQIAVANRISTQGWTRPDKSVQRPAGFASWHCGGRPELMSFTPDSVLAQAFHWEERGQVVRDLQLMLGLPRDGIYSRRTSKRHAALLAARGLPPALAGAAQ